MSYLFSFKALLACSLKSFLKNTATIYITSKQELDVVQCCGEYRNIHSLSNVCWFVFSVFSRVVESQKMIKTLFACRNKHNSPYMYNFDNFLKEGAGGRKSMIPCKIAFR